MDKETLNMHKTFLQTVRIRINEAELLLSELRLVEKYHANIINAGSKISKNNELGNDLSNSGNIDISGKKRHEIAAMALKHIGHSAGVPEIAKWLRSHNYEPKMNEITLRSQLFTSLKRHNDLFKRHKHDGKTKWELLAKK
jgi:hypothetical protein